MKITTAHNAATAAPIASAHVSPADISADRRAVVVRIGDFAVTLSRGEIHRLFDEVEGAQKPGHALAMRPER